MRVAVVGDSGIDIRRTGTSTRTSPEDPNCLVLSQIERKADLAMAGNVAKWLAVGGGFDVDLYTLYVRDQAGSELQRLCWEANIKLDPYLGRVTADGCTTVKERICVQERPSTRFKQLVRCDTERPLALTAYDYDHLTMRLRTDYDAVVVADYDKGMFGGRCGEQLREMIAWLEESVTVVNTKRPDSWAKYPVDYLVCNAKEALQINPEAANNIDGVAALHWVVTKSDKGVSCYTEEAEWHFPSQGHYVTDCTGCGDAFTAGLATARLQSATTDVCLQQAQEWAAHCLTQVGCGFPKKGRKGTCHDLKGYDATGTVAAA